jgi:hypothetical protein
MAIALVGSGKEGANDGFTTATFDSTGANLLVVNVANTASTSLVVSDNKSGGNLNALTASVSDIFNRISRLYWVIMTGGTGHTITVTGTDENIGLTWAYFSGVHASPIGGTEGAGTAGFGTSFAISSVTPSENDCLVVAGMMNDTAPGHAINGGFTMHQALQGSAGVYLGSAIASLIQTTAAAAGPTWSWTGDQNASGSSAWFKAAGAGGGATPTPVPRSQFRRGRRFNRNRRAA